MALTLLEVIKLRGKKTFIFCAEEDSRGASDFANAMRLKCSLFLALCQSRDRQSAVMVYGTTSRVFDQVERENLFLGNVR